MLKLFWTSEVDEKCNDTREKINDVATFDAHQANQKRRNSQLSSNKKPKHIMVEKINVINVEKIIQNFANCC